MHASSYENMERCYQLYIEGSDLEKRASLKVLDVGGADVNGSYSDIFNGKNVDYLGSDLTPGPGVSIVLEDPNKLPLPDASIDIVISGQMLEHCEFFWLTFAEMVRVVKEDGFIFLIAPSGGPIHNYPVDCYRFYPDGFRAIAKYTNCHLIDIWHDNRGPWNDLVGIFNKTGIKPDIAKTASLSDVRAINYGAPKTPTAYEKVQGELPSLEVLECLHETLQPQNYLEIGVRLGKSLGLAKCTAVGVDPVADVQVDLLATTRLVEQKSDDFFRDGSDPILESKPDLVFIDGMHLFEYALRDFMNVEKISGPDTVVCIDDILPNVPEQATRDRKTINWTGDVWKLYQCLKRFRPDLTLILLDSSPTGLLLVTGLNGKHRGLWESYNPIVRWVQNNLIVPGDDILERREAVSPTGEPFKNAIQIIHAARMNGLPLTSQKAQIKRALEI